LRIPDPYSLQSKFVSVQRRTEVNAGEKGNEVESLLHLADFAANPDTESRVSVQTNLPGQHLASIPQGDLRTSSRSQSPSHNYDPSGR
jgi:hypothetical protein